MENRTQAPPERLRRGEFWAALRTLAYGLVGLGLALAVTLGVHRLDHRWGLTWPTWTIVPGIILMLGGAILGLTCVAMFITLGQGTPALFDPPKVFVARGTYRFIRNPMYIGVLAMLIGFGLALGSVLILVLSVLLFLVIHGITVIIEEPGLEKRFGESYLVYMRSVNRWFPGKPRRQSSGHV